MRIHVSFIDRVGITQEVLALLGGRNLNLDAVEMVPPNVYIDAPTLSPQVLEELRDALFNVRGVQAVTVVDILPGQRRHLQLDALLAAMTDPVLALDSAGKVLLANPALIALYRRAVCRPRTAGGPAGKRLSPAAAGNHRQWPDPAAGRHSHYRRRCPADPVPAQPHR
jgi:transcriptional regulator of aromatic amino acid metabolism